MPGSERVSPIKVTDANYTHPHSTTTTAAAVASVQSPQNQNHHPASTTNGPQQHNNSCPPPSSVHSQNQNHNSHSTSIASPLTNGLVACNSVGGVTSCHPVTTTATGGGDAGQNQLPVQVVGLETAGGLTLHPTGHVLTQGDLSAGSTLVQEVVTNASVLPPVPQQQQPPGESTPVTVQSNGGSGGNSKASPRESGEDSEDESEILEESPCGRWLKRREEVSRMIDGKGFNLENYFFFT